RLQISQLDTGGLGRQEMGCIHQALGGGELALGVDDFRALLALGLGLLGHGAQHGLGHIHLFDLDVGDFHAPGRGVLIEDALQAQVDLVAVGEEFVEFLLAEHRTQSSLRKLRSLVGVIGDFDDGFLRIDDAEKNDGIHLQGDVVAGDDVLGRNFEGFLAERNAHHAVDRTEDQNYAWTLGCNQASQAEDDTAFIFGQNLDGTQQVNNEDNDSYDGHRKSEIHKCLQTKRNSGMSGL